MIGGCVWHHWCIRRCRKFAYSVSAHCHGAKSRDFGLHASFTAYFIESPVVKLNDEPTRRLVLLRYDGRSFHNFSRTRPIVCRDAEGCPGLFRSSSLIRIFGLFPYVGYRWLGYTTT